MRSKFFTAKAGRREVAAVLLLSAFCFQLSVCAAETTRRRAAMVASRTVKLSSNIVGRTVSAPMIFFASPVDSKDPQVFLDWWTKNQPTKVERVGAELSVTRLDAKSGTNMVEKLSLPSRLKTVQPSTTTKPK